MTNPEAAKPNEWRKCTSCRASIDFGGVAYWVCNVSTCQKKRAGLVFCSMDCWDAHLPVLRHKEAWAIELNSPTSAEWSQVLVGEREDPTYPARAKTGNEAGEDVAPAVERPKSNAPAAVLRRRRPD